eukprot:4703779-Amphidinium_carterae.1
MTRVFAVLWGWEAGQKCQKQLDVRCYMSAGPRKRTQDTDLAFLTAWSFVQFFQRQLKWQGVSILGLSRRPLRRLLLDIPRNRFVQVCDIAHPRGILHKRE